MQAMVFDTHGPRTGELRMVELPDPEPGPGEVRVRVHVSAVNPTDWKARDKPPGTLPWPVQVPGQDGAGVIDRVGAGVDPSRIGRRVWLHIAAHGHAGGTSAQYVCVPERRAAPLPDPVSLDVGAGLGVPALTAHRCLFADGPLDGRTVLVTGGGGSVGHAAIQLARQAGARVITTISGPEKSAIAVTARPDVLLNYRDADHTEQLRAAAPDGVDRVVDVDIVANLPTYLMLLNQGASVVSYSRPTLDAQVTASIAPLMTNNVVLRFMLLYGVPVERLDEAVEHVGRLLRTDALTPMPPIRYPLAELEAAHAHSRAGAAGKVLIDIPD